MKKSIVYLFILTIFSGCGGKLQEVADEAVAELATTQSLSSYHEVSVDVSVNGNSASLTCQGGGSIDFGETADGAGCYQSQMRTCEIEGERATLTLSGSSRLCSKVGEEIVPPEDNDSGIQALVGKELLLSGEINAQGENTEKRTCVYDLTFSNISADAASSEEGSEVSVQLDVAGSVCDRAVDLNVDFTISGQVEVESGS